MHLEAPFSIPYTVHGTPSLSASCVVRYSPLVRASWLLPPRTYSPRQSWVALRYTKCPLVTVHRHRLIFSATPSLYYQLVMHYVSCTWGNYAVANCKVLYVCLCTRKSGPCFFFSFFSFFLQQKRVSGRLSSWLSSVTSAGNTLLEFVLTLILCALHYLTL